jgi:hypothetical protein
MDSFYDSRLCCYKLNIDPNRLQAIKDQLLQLATFTNADDNLELPSDGSSRCNVYPLDDLDGEVKSFIDQFDGLVLPILRVCNLKPKRSFFPHIDANVHGLFSNTPAGHIMPATINIVATPNSTSSTKWYRQTIDNKFLNPWASYTGESPNLEQVDQMVVNDDAVLFRTGQWHSVENASDTNSRVVASIFFNYTISWDNAVALMADQDLLIPRY